MAAERIESLSLFEYLRLVEQTRARALAGLDSWKDQSSLDIQPHPERGGLQSEKTLGGRGGNAHPVNT